METRWWLLWVLGAAALLGICPGSSSSHSLRYFYTAVSEPCPGLPSVIIVAYLDDELFAQYDSNTRKLLPRVPWIEDVGREDPQYWERNSRMFRNTEQQIRAALVDVPRYYNQSGGFHTWQGMYGCELRADGTRGGYRQFGYDGRDFLSLDKQSLEWTGDDAEAQICKRRLDAQSANNQYWKSYLEEECFDWLQRYLDYGKEALLRKDLPMVKVMSKVERNGVETLVCQAHGFFPKAIDATWRKDGEILEHETFRRDVAPNSDGTFHTLLSIQIDSKDRDRYRCHVEHDSLLEPLDLAWEETEALASNMGLIIGCVVGAVLLVVAVIAGIYLYKIRRGDYKAASMSDRTSDSSSKGSNPAI